MLIQHRTNIILQSGNHVNFPLIYFDRISRRPGESGEYCITIPSMLIQYRTV